MTLLFLGQLCHLVPGSGDSSMKKLHRELKAGITLVLQQQQKNKQPSNATFTENATSSYRLLCRIKPIGKQM